MSQLGEIVFKTVLKLNYDCPFCKSEECSEDESEQLYEHVNSSSCLGAALIKEGHEKPKDRWAFILTCRAAPTESNLAKKLFETVKGKTVRVKDYNKITKDAKGISNIFSFPKLKTVKGDKETNTPGYNYKIENFKSWKNGKYLAILNSFPSVAAHHVIPGNDSLRKVPQLLEYFATTVKWKKVIRVKPEKDGTFKDYSKDKMKEVRRHCKGLVKNVNKEPVFVTFNFVRKTKIEDGEDSIGYQTIEDAGFNEVTETRISGKVLGKIKYTINCFENGIWLPGNYAVHGWSEWEKSDFQRKYALGAMRASAAQFHDTHTNYSKEVAKMLENLFDELQLIDVDCEKRAGKGEEEHKARKDKKPKAPEILTACLNDLSNELRGFLVGSPKDWLKPFLTSGIYSKNYFYIRDNWKSKL